MRNVLSGHLPNEGMVIPVSLLSGVADDVETLASALEDLGEAEAQREIERLRIPKGGYEEMAAKLTRTIDECATDNRTLREALEAARRDLVFFGGLEVVDGAAPEESWKLDTSKVVAKIDAALGEAPLSEAGEGEGGRP